ncbi:hypothetical protein BDZ45DRAFT_388904 [Acephala macrosclerotiorum]|nr:hypothetical protein BDZ45DRAFT_388904 [Acephala macrosclerotiorum]
MYRDSWNILLLGVLDLEMITLRSRYSVDAASLLEMAGTTTVVPSSCGCPAPIQSTFHALTTFIFHTSRLKQRSTMDVQQALGHQMQALQEENAALKSNIQAIQDELINATKLSLSRMLIEASTAANDLRASLPEDELEDGEVEGEPERMNVWKQRLDNMLLKIGQAHEKAEGELQDVARKIAGMTVVVVHEVLATNVQKRPWSLAVLQDTYIEEGPPKRARYDARERQPELSTMQLRGGGPAPDIFQPLAASGFNVPARLGTLGGPLQMPVQARLPFHDITAPQVNTSEGLPNTGGMHSDRLQLLQRGFSEDPTNSPVKAGLKVTSANQTAVVSSCLRILI